MRCVTGDAIATVTLKSMESFGWVINQIMTLSNRHELMVCRFINLHLSLELIEDLITMLMLDRWNGHTVQVALNWLQQGS